jgi:hypothetical protein
MLIGQFWMVRKLPVESETTIVLYSYTDHPFFSFGDHPMFMTMLHYILGFLFIQMILIAKGGGSIVTYMMVSLGYKYIHSWVSLRGDLVFVIKMEFLF